MPFEMEDLGYYNAETLVDILPLNSFLCLCQIEELQGLQIA